MALRSRAGVAVAIPVGSWAAREIRHVATNPNAQTVRIGEQTMIAVKRFLPCNIFPLFEKAAPPFHFFRWWGTKGYGR
jgi:hypothetical protein